MQVLFFRDLASAGGTGTPALGRCGSFLCGLGRGLHYREAQRPSDEMRHLRSVSMLLAEPLVALVLRFTLGSEANNDGGGNTESYKHLRRRHASVIISLLVVDF
jgi:hypothetical protein